MFRGRVSAGAAFGNNDDGFAQNAVAANHIAFLPFLDNRTRRFGRIVDFLHDFMLVRVEHQSDAFDCRNDDLFLRLSQILLR